MDASRLPICAMGPVRLPVPVPRTHCDTISVLLVPSVIEEIHRAYLDAGAAPTRFEGESARTRCGKAASSAPLKITSTVSVGSGGATASARSSPAERSCAAAAPRNCGHAAKS